jgi:hypothetical protein
MQGSDMPNHEYALIGGLNRSKVGRYLSLIAAGTSGAIVFVLLKLVDIAKQFGLPANLPPSILSLLGAGSVFAILYWLFDRYMWRWKYVDAWLKVPNLSGDWSCQGKTLDQATGSATHLWHGTVTIVQSWDKFRVRLKTPQSGSNSVTAALICDDADGYRLLYNYRNDPRIGETNLKSHLGFAELVFAKDLTSADGEYFNGHGRYTFGEASSLIRASWK